MIGQGSYGNVCEAIHRKTGTKVAIKKMMNLFSDEVDTKRMLREIHILRMLESEHVVKLLDIIEPINILDFNCLFLVLEHA